MKDKACWVVTGCGREPGGLRVAETGCCPMATELAVVRKPVPDLPYPLCPLMESPSAMQVREMVRRLVEAAV